VACVLDPHADGWRRAKPCLPQSLPAKASLLEGAYADADAE
jgi:hypothetical protein